MKVLVTGGRDYDNQHALNAALDQFHAHIPIDLLINGGAHGADAMAATWAWNHGIHVATIRANWDRHGKAAGPMRNQAMLQLLPHIVIAFAGGRGTADMVARAKAAGVRVMHR